MKKLVSNAALIVALTMAVPSAFALTAAQAKAVKKAVTSVPVAEMPATAAELVKNSSKEDREAVAVTAVRAGIYKSRASARLMVAAVSKAAPEVAPAVARAASEMEAGQASQIASAAITAAPAARAEINTSVSRGVASSASVTTVGSTTTRARGAAAAPATAVVTQSNNPIAGGTYPATPPNQAPDPIAVDYTQPRS